MARRQPAAEGSRTSRRAATLAVCALLVLPALGGGAVAALDARDGADGERGEPDGAILELYPDPVRGNDAGEYVLLSLPEPGNWSVSDGESAVRLRNRSGRVLVTDEPGSIPPGAGAGPNGTLPVVVDDGLELSNGGESVTLRRDGAVVQRVDYGESTEGERYLPASDEWRPVGFEPRDAVHTCPTNATAFLLPDSPEVPIETLRGADERLLLAGYTFSSQRVADVLVRAADRGVDVRVLVEAAPVGGISTRQARTLDRLFAAGVDVRVGVVGAARFNYHHPKYAVADDRALVLTENWKPAGTGGAASRGWGVRTENGSTADALASLFRDDADAIDTRGWPAFREGRQFERVPAANGSYPTGFAPERVHARNVTLLTAPGNAETELVSAIDGAEERIDVLQPSLGRQANSLVEATLRAAQRGVEVRVLLSGAWYVAEENAALVAWLNGWAERTDAPLTARVAEPAGRYEKIHAKGLLIDDDLAVVGSLNWNENSATENREVALALHGPEPVAFYRESFDADWRGGEGSRTWLFAAGAVAAVVVAGLVAVRSLDFAAVEE
ncbi:phospholipase D-like domain-containing protein [Halolamina litorea]|uniref:Phospholipase D-like domain-containing protein n=1 Tax=Halolamina litorea TaxID=1515593 RepID=A0ABD6BRR2_9EURY